MNEKKLVKIIILLSILLATYEFLFYPKMIVTQISLSGEERMGPKSVAVLIPLMMSILGGVVFLKSSKYKYFNLSIIGLIILIIHLFMNFKI